MQPAVETAAPGYRWVILGLFCTNLIAGTFLGVSLGLLLPSILRDIAMSPVQQGWLGSSIRLGSAILAVPAAWLLSRYSPRTVRTVAGLAGAALAFGQALAPNFAALFAARAGYGIASIATQPTSALLIRQWFPNREIAIVNGVTIFVIGVMEFATSALTPFLVDRLGGWRPALMVAGGWALLSGILWVVFGRERVTSDYSQPMAALDRPPIWSVFHYRELWLVCAGLIGGPAVWWAFGTFWPAYMQRTSDLSLSTIGFVFGLTSLGMAPAGLLFGFLASRFDASRWILVFCGLSQAIFSFVLLTTDAVPVLILAGMMVGFAWGFVPIVTTIPYQLPGISPREVAVAASLVSSMFALGGVVGPVITGVMQEVTGSTFTALAIMCCFPLSICAIGLGMPRSGSAVAEVVKEA